MFKDINRLLRQITVNIFVVNSLFYLSILIYYISFKYHADQRFIENVVMIALANILFIICFIGYVKKNKIIYYLTLLYSLFTSFMALTENMGTLDFIVLFLSLTLFVTLILQMRTYTR